MQSLLRRLARPRRFQRPVLLVVVAGIAAVVGAGLAFGETRSTPLGSGVVVIETNLAYEGGQAAGTGIVLSSSGEVLTNNHVIRGATTIKVVVPGAGRSYTARVVGYDITDDVAVLQARGATNLETISLGNSAKLKLGQAVTAVGNAGGTGSLVSAAGRVTGLARSITVGDDSGGGARLTGLIETNAALQAGDSGGPLLDASGNVIGMDTAASVDSGFQELASSDGYAIPINKAIAIARRIEGGKASATVHVGGTAFLGVQLDADSFGDSSGALVAGILPGGPAAAAGLEPGNVITAFDGHAISTPAALSALVLADKPRARVSVTYVDQAGAKHGTTVTLGSGPPQ